MVEWSLRTVLHDPQAVGSSFADDVFREAKRPEAGKAWRSWQRHEIGLGGYRTNFVNQLHTLAMPTLILHAEEDLVWPIEEGEQLQAMVAGSRLIRLPSRNHILQPDEPAFALLLDEVDRFLAS